MKASTDATARSMNPGRNVAVGATMRGKATLVSSSALYRRLFVPACNVDAKYAQGKGVYRDGSDASALKDPSAIGSSVDEYSQANIDAVVAYCEYVHRTYGRFFGNFGPLRSLMAYQVHHIDTEFYDRFYRAGAYRDAHRDHFDTWH